MIRSILNSGPQIYRDADSLAPLMETFRANALESGERCSGICGFDGFIDTFVRLQSPASMAEFGPKVAAAAGVATSYPAYHLGEKFGGNGPLLAAALNDIHQGAIDITYIGGIGKDGILPIFQNALRSKTKTLYSLASAAVTTCLEFTDGKIMLNDMAPCAEITWDRILEHVGLPTLDEELKAARFIAAVNWGKLPHAGPIWSSLASRLSELGMPAKSTIFFMDLAEFETRPLADREDLLGRLDSITRQCETLLSFNLKEAWQMAEVFSGTFHGRKDADSVAELAEFLKNRIVVDRIIVHPNDGAACSGNNGTVYVAGPYCSSPLISTGAGDNFGAGCLAGAIRGFDDASILLAGNCASGHFVRSGHTPSFTEMIQLMDAWSKGSLVERLA
jgi:hypothetical protein